MIQNLLGYILQDVLGVYILYALSTSVYPVRNQDFLAGRFTKASIC